MKKSNFTLALAVLGALILSVLPANASTLFNFSYSGSGFSGSGQFTADLVSGSEYNVVNVSGTANSSIILPGVNGYAGATNKLYFPGSPLYVILEGISFQTADLLSWNIYGYQGNYGIMNDSFCPSGNVSCGVQISLNVEAVPLPAALPLLLGGLGGLAWMARRKKRNTLLEGHAAT